MASEKANAEETDTIEPDSENDTICSSCNKILTDTVNNCSACRSVTYCDKKCQKKHWKMHKDECTYSFLKKMQHIPILQQIKAAFSVPMKLLKKSIFKEFLFNCNSFLIDPISDVIYDQLTGYHRELSECTKLTVYLNDSSHKSNASLQSTTKYNLTYEDLQHCVLCVHRMPCEILKEKIQIVLLKYRDPRSCGIYNSQPLYHQYLRDRWKEQRLFILAELYYETTLGKSAKVYGDLIREVLEYWEIREHDITAVELMGSVSHKTEFHDLFDVICDENIHLHPLRSKYEYFKQHPMRNMMISSGV